MTLDEFAATVTVAELAPHLDPQTAHGVEVALLRLRVIRQDERIAELEADDA